MVAYTNLTKIGSLKYAEVQAYEFIKDIGVLVLDKKTLYNEAIILEGTNACFEGN
ncbi:hypothetical protein [Bacillus methanolicus]|uniref:hypothetical protein n=1 Tax=Bacillus methanolicus TaxID=1471 RepID=UPI00238095DD|nr:hypothetical protein [Bacillus methanolicus]